MYVCVCDFAAPSSLEGVISRNILLRMLDVCAVLLDGWVSRLVPHLLDPLSSQRRLGSLIVLDVADGV